MFQGGVVPSTKLGGQERGGHPPPPPPTCISLPVARAGKRSSTVIRNQWMQGAETRQCQTSIRTFRRSLGRAWPEVCRWITYLARSSSSRELRAGRTAPMVIALLWLQTLLNRCETCPRLSQFKLSVSAYRSAAK